MIAGANAYLNKGCDSRTLMEAIQTVHKSGVYFEKSIPKNLIEDIVYNNDYDHSTLEEEPLSEREKEVLFHICKGKPCPEIGEILNVSTRTVENHKSKIFKKLNVSSCTQMMEKAIKKGYYQISL